MFHVYGYWLPESETVVNHVKSLMTLDIRVLQRNVIPVVKELHAIQRIY
jgi:hypothetical protein